jgi:tight adherence protein B
MTADFLILVAVSFAIAMGTLGGGWMWLEARRKRRALELLENKPETPRLEVVILREDKPEGRESLLTAFSRRIEERMRRAGMDGSARRVLQLQAAFFMTGFLGGMQFPLFLPPLPGGLVLGAAAAMIPYWNLGFKARKRVAEFEEQFPEALDFLSRSMRAGHAFAISLGLLAEDAPDPLGAEFRKVTHEHALGAPLSAALESLSVRMPSLDVRFFVSAVLLQAETGGNLSEILNKLSSIIRDRFRLRGQVKAASAHGRITGSILMVMPILLAIGMTAIAPGYLQTMWDDPDGRMIVFGAIAGQALGCIAIQKIVRIKV